VVAEWRRLIADLTERGRRDDAKAFDRVDQQKCLGHSQRSTSEVLETKAGPSPRRRGGAQGAAAGGAGELWHAHYPTTIRSHPNWRLAANQ
jgi:hypothetical protein